MNTKVSSPERFKWWREFRGTVVPISLLLSLLLIVLWVSVFVSYEGYGGGDPPFIAYVLLVTLLSWVVLIGFVVPLAFSREASAWRAYLSDVASGIILPAPSTHIPIPFDGHLTDFASFNLRIAAPTALRNASDVAS